MTHRPHPNQIFLLRIVRLAKSCEFNEKEHKFFIISEFRYPNIMNNYFSYETKLNTEDEEIDLKFEFSINLNEIEIFLLFFLDNFVFLKILMILKMNDRIYLIELRNIFIEINGRLEIYIYRISKDMNYYIYISIFLR